MGKMCMRITEIGHDAEPLGTVRLIFLDQASREKTLAQTDAVVREKTGCITPMAIWHHVGMASIYWQEIKNTPDAIYATETC